MNTDTPLDEPVDDVVMKACRNCGRLFYTADWDGTDCRTCTELDDGPLGRDQNGFRIRSEHVPK